MFAFAIWDERDRTCLLARDRFGIKPLYYHAHDDAAADVRVGSAGARLRSGAVPRRARSARPVSATSAPDRCPSRARCCGVCAPRGRVTSLTWHAGPRADTTSYWSLPIRRPATAPPDPSRRRARRLLDSVRHHFVSDVPVGIFLSGGIDSTALRRAGARRPARRPAHLLAGASRARRTTKGPRAPHRGAFRRPARASVRRCRDRPGACSRGFLGAMDQPSIDGFNTFAVSQFRARARA